MVHTKLNEKETNPNPHINFITALPSHDPADEEAARQLLRALAAQVRPLMKSNGFSINSFEEYEHNEVFAGRNWNAGETVELVLRRPDGTFLPTFWLMSTLCHELSHIKHMNHGPAFQALWKRLNNEVRTLQSKGYYGDGYWSSGTRLADSVRISGQGIAAGDLPEYVCGGAQTHKRPSKLRPGPRRPRKSRDTTITASTKSGRQTTKPRKAGIRVTSKSAFTGEGIALVAEASEGKGNVKGTGFGKQAASKRAREERALAIERRIQALQTQSQGSTSNLGLSRSETETDDGDSDSDGEHATHETDSDRRQTLFSSEQDDNLQELKSGTVWQHFGNDFTSTDNKLRGDLPGCDLPMHSGSIGTYGDPQRLPPSKGKRKRPSGPTESDGGSSLLASPASKKMTTKVSPTLSIGTLVHSEIDLRKKESLGMAPVKRGGRTIGTVNARDPSLDITEMLPSPHQWSCLVCTLHNTAEHLACSACATPRGERQQH